MPSSIAATRSLRDRLQHHAEQSATRRVKSRFHSSCPRAPGSAGYSTSRDLGPRRAATARSRSALAWWRASRTASVRRPRRPRKQSSVRRGDAHVGPQPVQRRDASPRCATITPSSTSEWPPMYLVAACTDTSTPWSNARKPSGVAHVLSRITSAPRACATCGDRGNVLHLERQRARRLGEHEARVGPELALDRGAQQRIVIADVDAEAPQVVARRSAASARRRHR